MLHYHLGGVQLNGAFKASVNCTLHCIVPLCVCEQHQLNALLIAICS